jgi:hypothetical protein
LLYIYAGFTAQGTNGAKLLNYTDDKQFCHPILGLAPPKIRMSPLKYLVTTARFQKYFKVLQIGHGATARFYDGLTAYGRNLHSPEKYLKNTALFYLIIQPVNMVSLPSLNDYGRCALSGPFFGRWTSWSSDFL